MAYYMNDLESAEQTWRLSDTIVNHHALPDMQYHSTDVPPEAYQM